MHAWVVKQFPSEGNWENAVSFYPRQGLPWRSRSIRRGLLGTGEVVPFGEVCLGRNHSQDGAKLNMRWMRGVLS